MDIEKLKYWYKTGLWTAEMIQTAVDKGKLTQEQADEILNI